MNLRLRAKYGDAMTETAYYIIRKQILDIRHRKGINAFAEQTELSNRYRKEVVPLLEAICRELCPADRLVKIDRLVMDLPPMSEKNYKAKWAEEVGKAFRKSLSKAIAQAPEPQNRNAEVLGKAEADIQLLTFFLYTGMLPWSHTAHQNHILEMIFGELVKKEPKTIRRMLAEGLKHDSFTKRLCYQFSESLLVTLFDVLQPGNTENIKNIYYALRQYFESAAHWSDPVFLLGYYSLKQLAEQPYRDERQFTERVLRQMANAKNIAYRKLLDKLLEAAKPKAAQGTKNSLLKTLKTLHKEAVIVPEEPSFHSWRQEEDAVSEAFFQRELTQMLREAEELVNASGEEKKLLYGKLKERTNECIRLTERHFPGAGAKRRELTEAIRQFLKKPGPGEGTTTAAYQRFKTAIEALLEKFTPHTAHEQDIPVQVPDTPELEGIYLQNAGIIIVWPFITQLFEALKFTEDRRFISGKKQHRAVHLLQYLASGAENSSEDKLVLSKLLCGLPLSEPVPRQLTLLQEEKVGAEDLIKAAIHHWKEMKNTSVQGFREAFLMREGKLTRNRNDWFLQVAQRSYDIIMDRLPWTISLARLPWMPEPIFVEW